MLINRISNISIFENIRKSTRIIKYSKISQYSTNIEYLEYRISWIPSNIEYLEYRISVNPSNIEYLEYLEYRISGNPSNIEYRIFFEFRIFLYSSTPGFQLEIKINRYIVPTLNHLETLIFWNLWQKQTYQRKLIFHK